VRKKKKERKRRINRNRPGGWKVHPSVPNTGSMGNSDPLKRDDTETSGFQGQGSPPRPPGSETLALAAREAATVASRRRPLTDHESMSSGPPSMISRGVKQKNKQQPDHIDEMPEQRGGGGGRHHPCSPPYAGAEERISISPSAIERLAITAAGNPEQRSKLPEAALVNAKKKPSPLQNHPPAGRYEKDVPQWPLLSTRRQRKSPEVGPNQAIRTRAIGRADTSHEPPLKPGLLGCAPTGFWHLLSLHRCQGGEPVERDETLNTRAGERRRRNELLST